jgi:hypothetical protein
MDAVASRKLMAEIREPKDAMSDHRLACRKAAAGISSADRISAFEFSTRKHLREPCSVSSARL